MLQAHVTGDKPSAFVEGLRSFSELAERNRAAGRPIFADDPSIPSTPTDASPLFKAVARVAVCPRPKRLSAIDLIKIDGRSALLILREKPLTESCECAACSARLDPARDGALAAQVVVDSQLVNLDGLFCCENCAAEEAQIVNLVDPRNAGK